MTKNDDKGSGSKDDKVRSPDEIFCRVLVEVLGAPKEHIEQVISMLVDKIYEEDYLEVKSEETFEAKERGKLFSTFSEMDIWFKDLESLEKFMFDYTPSSVEIIDPENLSVNSRLLSGILNDFLLKMHETAFKFKDLSAHSRALAGNTDAVIRNFLVHVLKEPMSEEDMSKTMGIPLDNIKAILDKFSKVGVAEKKGDLWHLVKKRDEAKDG